MHYVNPSQGSADGDVMVGFELDARCADCAAKRGAGTIADVVTAPAGATEVTLRHTAESPRDRDDSWHVYYAVLRVEQTGRPMPVRLEVIARRAPSGATPPRVAQVL